MIEAYAQRKEAEYTAAINRANELEAKGTGIMESNAEALTIIPSEYWYPLATNYIYKVIQTGRAISINQALQMFGMEAVPGKIRRNDTE
jgi:hypothetical protein